MGALVYLALCSWKNRVRTRVRRLREIRYAAGLVVGFLYFYFVVYRPGRPGRMGPLAAIAAAHDPIELVGSIGIFLVVALAWLWPSSGQAALLFSRADVQFLFPAPFTRRQLLAYKVLRTQISTIFSTALVTIFFRPGTASGGWIFFIGITVLTAAMFVHLTGVSLSRASLRQHRTPGWSRHRWPPTIVFVAVALLAGSVAMDWGRLASTQTGADLGHELYRLGTTGAASVVLWPFRALVRLPLARDTGEFLRALPFALGLVALNFVWVLQSDTAFEEGSAELAEKAARARRGERLTTKRVKRRAAPFTLPLSGPVETALFWKNLILLGRYSPLRIAIMLLPVIAAMIGAAAGGGSGHGLAEGAAILCLALAAMTIVMGPMVMRNDLRQDLANLEVLKAWPVSGAALVRGESLAPAVVLTGIVWLGIIGAVALSSRLYMVLGATTVARLSTVLAAMIVAPGIIATQVVVQNGLAVLFPAWITVGVSRAHGLDVMGQRMLMLAGTLVTVLLAVLPAALLGAIAGAAIYFVTSVISVLLPAAVVGIVLVAECALASEALGRVLDRTDPAAVEPVE
jgi:ABC-2 type transport system permease protein